MTETNETKKIASSKAINDSGDSGEVTDRAEEEK